MPEPARPKIYHIVHVDRLPSIVADGNLWCDAIVAHRGASGTMIGISKIKQRRRTKSLPSYPELCVGDCVPFYFCPRSVMLFPIFTRNNPDLTYKGGQEPIIHLEADLRDVVSWANKNERAGCSRKLVQAPPTLTTFRIWRSWIRSIGMQCEPKGGQERVFPKR